MEGCPKCSGIGYLLGQLGAKLWFRCRSCGWDFHIHARDFHPDHTSW